jgi:hypothetical protein
MKIRFGDGGSGHRRLTATRGIFWDRAGSIGLVFLDSSEGSGYRLIGGRACHRLPVLLRRHAESQNKFFISAVPTVPLESRTGNVIGVLYERGSSRPSDGPDILN